MDYHLSLNFSIFSYKSLDFTELSTIIISQLAFLTYYFLINTVINAN